MKQTPIHEIANMDILNLIPPDCKRVIEIGSSSGALAREYKKINPACHYTGIEIDGEYAEQSMRYCDRVIHGSIESFDDNDFKALLPSDCWIFADVLEHLVDPWALLRRIRSHSTDDTSIVVCLPNAQHWSVQARLNCGRFVYEDSGLLDRTHLRWFTRLTLIELFSSTGFQIVSAGARVFETMEPGEEIRNAIKMMAEALGTDAETAISDALAFQWVARAVPA
ncbi:MAG: class I SAM-dependent methyltransferase [Propionivibrio sp.]|jgi:hypothetical protein|uniref:class I SAM-dependent methyltransferase n=1 Tax=Propionivibrio sp. TaxID=2212460 RepID=UPI001B53EEB9|nr:class I SAM-dependent methyltransferase [Propionivibrio sp.]MBP7204450.1 class I SAM-dependent methyltransferase [Propionivibrio sp.]